MFAYFWYFLILYLVATYLMDMTRTKSAPQPPLACVLIKSFRLQSRITRRTRGVWQWKLFATVLCSPGDAARHESSLLQLACSSRTVNRISAYARSFSRTLLDYENFSRDRDACEKQLRETVARNSFLVFSTRKKRSHFPAAYCSHSSNSNELCWFAYFFELEGAWR